MPDTRYQIYMAVGRADVRSAYHAGFLYDIEETNRILATQVARNVGWYAIDTVGRLHDPFGEKQRYLDILADSMRR